LWIRGGARNDVRRRKLSAHLKSYMDGYRSSAIVLYNASGRVLLAVGEVGSDVQTLGVEVCKAKAPDEVKFIDLHRHRNSSRSTVLGFLSPLNDGAKCIGGIYLEEDPAQYLFPLMREWPGDSKTGETLLVRKNGRQVQFLSPLRYRPEASMEFTLPLDTLHLPAAIALRGKQGVLEHVLDYRGKYVLAYATAIDGTNWILISKMDEDEEYQVINQMQWLAGILAIFFFGATGAGFWQWRRRELMGVDAAIIKERLRAESLQREGEKHFRAVFEHTTAAMARNSPNGEFIEVNDAFCKLFGYSREEIVAQHLSWQQLVHPEHLKEGLSLVKQLLSGEIADFKLELRYLHKEGEVIWGSLQVALIRDQTGAPEYMVAAIQDITDRKQAEQTISFMAYHDKLTGLPNRALLFDRLSQAMSRAKRNSKYVALLFADLDGFKAVNDECGHEVGDNVLKIAAQRFLACVREVDTVARFGGDEFAIVLGNLDEQQQAAAVAEKILQSFAQDITLEDGNVYKVGTSIGISIYPDHGNAMDNLITAADHAMYASKSKGKNTYTFFREEAPSRRELPWVHLENNHRIGVKEIDEQHYNLLQMVNQLNEELSHDDSHKSVMGMLDELLKATVHHFKTESRYMADYGYPEKSKHEAEHEQLLNQAKIFKEQFEQGRELLVMQSVKDWLLDHIGYSDKKLGFFLQEHGAK
jgi:diguanylate cyclase (GGDEF)-like protein/PAS domain S-box-containing protein/hemerythrin-like metal-binding protein